ncbi:MAG TPA: hypothetical protein VFY92_04500 [Hyphomicrobiaceae bacterium]|nr:hypothetical protein [Hyphomicrobiaceae bacterium]
MYSFLVLLPLTLITGTLGGLLIFSPQVLDYVAFISSIEGQPDKTRLPIQIAAHIIAYAITCFVLVATTRTIAAPVSRERPDALCRIQMILEAIFVAVPSLIIVALATYANVRRAELAAVGPYVTAGQVQLTQAAMQTWVAVGLTAVGLTSLVVSGRFLGDRRFGVTLVSIVAGVPAALVVVLLARPLLSGSASWLLALVAGVGAVGLAASVAAVVLIERPLALFRSTVWPTVSITLTDALAAVAFATCVGLVVALLLAPIGTPSYIGMFPALLLVSATALIVIAAVFAKGSSPIAIISVAISSIVGLHVLVLLHLLDWVIPTREFRHQSEIPAVLQSGKVSAPPLGIAAIEEARGIPDLRQAFFKWLDVRRPAIEKYRAAGKAYPVVVVAAQGGGIYAAYHSALSLARLYDACPEFADHVFILSGVSGGALGSAVFAELLNGVPDAQRSKPAEPTLTCTARTGAESLERKVQKFFSNDFLSPLVDSALVLDVPRLVVPVLPFHVDRALALELAFEKAWRSILKDQAAGAAGKTPAFGLRANFYGRWSPSGPAPALFLGATGVNSGVPVLVSQIKWAQGQGLGLGRMMAQGSDKDVDELLRRAQSQSERTRNSVIANILDFRPDLQLATSTAVALSARFPYVTPPGNLKRSPQIEAPTGLHYQNIDVLELMDGAYFDNSGGSVAIDILEDLERYLWPRRAGRYPEFKGLGDDIRFHLVRFTDRPAQRTGTATQDEHFELLTPLIAFNTVRAARGAQLRGVRDLDKTKETFVYLSDPWFTPSLNWLLSSETKTQIDLRSWGTGPAEAEVCCRMRPVFPPNTDESTIPKWRRREILLYAKWSEAEKLNTKLAGRSVNASQLAWEVEKFLPNNQDSFNHLLTLVTEGEDRNGAAK